MLGTQILLPYRQVDPAEEMADDMLKEIEDANDVTRMQFTRSMRLDGSYEDTCDWQLAFGSRQNTKTVFRPHESGADLASPTRSGHLP